MKAIISSVVLIGALAPLAAAHAAETASEDNRPPLVLDTETGVHGGSGGTVLESAPLPGEVHERQGMGGPPGSASGITYFVEPTMDFGSADSNYTRAGAQQPAQPGSQPMPRPVPEPAPRHDPAGRSSHRPHPDVPNNGARGDIGSPGSPDDVHTPKPRRELPSGARVLPKLPRVPTPTN